MLSLTRFFKCSLVITAFFVSTAPASSLFDDPNMWESVSGTWVFQNDEVHQTDTNPAGIFLLKYKGSLPEEPFCISVQLEQNESYSDPEHYLRAFIVVRADPNGQTGQAFGIDNVNASSDRNLLWYRYPEPKERMDLSRNSTTWWSQWHQMLLAVNGPSYELYYDSTTPLQRSDCIAIQGHVWENIDQKSLFLRVEGSAAKFKNLQLDYLRDVSPPERFSIIEPVNCATLTSNRPQFQWKLVCNGSDDQREDFDYEITLYNADGKLVISDTVQQMAWQPQKTLAPGRYRWTVKAKTFYGTVWGGNISGTFTIPCDMSVGYDDVVVNDITPKHFSQARPELTWTWSYNGPIDSVELRLEGTLIVSGLTLMDNQLVWAMTQDLAQGLNNFELRFFVNSQEIARKNSIAIRTVIPDQYTLRKDGVMLKNGTVFVPYGTYRDPSDTRTSLNGVLEGGFNLTHSYYFEGSYGDTPNPAELDNLIQEARTYLQFCEQNGVKVFLGIRRSWIVNDRTDLIQKYVAALMGEPGLCTWFLADEPDWNGVSSTKTRDAYLSIRQVDPYHLVSFNYVHQSLIPRLLRTSDIIWCQAYCVPPSYSFTLGRINRMINEMRQGRQYSKDFAKSVIGKAAVPDAVWCVLQGFQFNWTGGIHHPNKKEIIAQTHIAMASKARGIVFYWLPQGYSIYSPPGVWDGFIQAGQDVNTVFPLLLETGLDLDVPSDLTGIIARVRKLDSGKVVLIAVNSQYESVGSQLVWQWQLPDSGWTSWNKIAGQGAGQWTVSAGTITITLEPLESLVLELVN